MKRFLSLFALCFALCANAQEKVGANSQNKVLIVPFEPKMYRSSLDQEISTKEDKNYDRIRADFRKGVPFNIDLESGKHTTTVTLLKLDTSAEARDLRYVYSSIGYDYVPLIDPATEEEEKEKEAEEIGVDKLKGKLKSFGRKKEKEEPEAGTRVENGEIVTRSDDREKYMKTRIMNPDLLRNLGEKYNVGKVIFINELDLNYSGSAETYAVGKSEKQIKIKIHYTVFSVDGEELASGAAISYFTDKYKDQREIIQVHMQEAARMITKAAGI